MTISFGDLTREHRANRAIDVADDALNSDWFAAFDGGHGGFDQLAIKRGIEAVILAFGVMARRILGYRRPHAGCATDRCRLPSSDR